MLELLPDEKYLPALIAAINCARSYIDIMAFKIEITPSKRGRKLLEFWAALNNKLGEGVRVRIITNQRESRSHIPDSNLYAVRELNRYGADLRKLPGSRVCHAKIVVIDYMTIFLGSHNLSVTSCANNLETSIMTDNTIIASYFNEFYEKAWSSARRI